MPDSCCNAMHRSYVVVIPELLVLTYMYVENPSLIIV